MRPQVVSWVALVALLLASYAAVAATATAVLTVEGMTCGS